MLDLASAFAPDYAGAREKFHAAAAARSLAVERHLHPSARGVTGEELAIDVVILGNADAAAVLFVSSAMHGVEGFCGSGCQVAFLGDDVAYAAIAGSGVAVLIVHAVNPFGFSHLRRTNEDNVDVNRNFRDFSAPPARNVVYDSLHPAIVPGTWPPDAANTAAIGGYIAKHGFAKLQAVISDGQADHPDGLFYVGRGPAWSNLTLRDVLQRHGARRDRLAWIDIHSGLGPWAHGERIHCGPDDPAMIGRAVSWYGADVTHVYDHSSTSSASSGLSYHAALDACPGAEFTGIVLEFGTRPIDDVLQALRGDQWLANHAGAGDAQREAIKRLMRAAFHDDSPTWQAMVYGQARVTLLQALRALGRRGDAAL
jgi:predicted deacylase